MQRAAQRSEESNSNYNLQVVGGPGIFAIAPTSASFRQNKTGWTVGGGVETSLPWLGNASRWSAKLEYLYVDLGNVDNTFTAPVTGSGSAAAFSYTSNTHFQDHIVRVGVNYRFGG